MTRAVRRPTQALLFLAAIIALACAPRAARAQGLPELVRQLPSSFDAAIVAPSLGALNAHASQLVTAMEMSTLSSIEQLVTVMGIRRGLAFDRGAAAVLAFPEHAVGRIRVSVIVPIEDYGTFAGNFIKGTGPQTKGISEFEYFGRRYFIKPLGEAHALIGETAESVREYEPAGTAEAFERLIGSAGVEAAQGAELSVVLDVARSKESIGRLAQTHGGRFASMAPDPEAAMKMLTERIGELARDGQGITIAFSPGQLGLGVEAVSHFRSGTPTAELCQSGSDARLIEALPGGASYLAGGMDLTHPAIARWFGRLLPAGFAEAVSKVSIIALMPNPPFLGNGGAQRTVVRFETDTPERPLEALETLLLQHDDERFEGQYARRYKVYDDVPIDGWSFIPADPRSVHPGIIGMRPDILGAAASHNGASYIFTTREKGVARAAMGLDGSPRFLESNKVVAQVRSMLPKAPSLELFVMPKPVLDDFASLIRFYKPDFTVSPQVPPAGLNLVIGGGAAIGSAFVPAPTLAHAIELFNIFLKPTKP